MRGKQILWTIIKDELPHLLTLSRKKPIPERVFGTMQGPQNKQQKKQCWVAPFRGIQMRAVKGEMGFFTVIWLNVFYRQELVYRFRLVHSTLAKKKTKIHLSGTSRIIQQYPVLTAVSGLVGNQASFHKKQTNAQKFRGVRWGAATGDPGETHTSFLKNTNWR